jgi:hypothetical protein
MGGMPNATYRGPMDALLRTYRREGLRALYGGFGAVMIGGTPGTVLYLTGYAFFRDLLSSAASGWRGGEGGSSSSSSVDENSFVVHFASGMLAEAVSCVIYVPVDVVKERMQVQQWNATHATTTTGGGIDPRQGERHYRGSLDALRKIARIEGVGGIYKGYGATLASFGPFSALYFMFYEQCKSRSKEYVHRKNGGGNIDATSDPGIIAMKDGDLPLIHLVACSAGAGALASWLTSPLDMAKLRLQVQRGQASRGGQVVRYGGMLDCLRSAYLDGGLRGLFRGAGARVLHFAPATTITMTCYEKCRAFYADTLG